MKRRILVVACCSFATCSTNRLPDSYGFYADTDRGMITLEPQKVDSEAQSLLSWTFGIQKPSGVRCKSIKRFIVYHKDVHPSQIRLSRLELVGRLWSPKSNIEIDIRPAKGRDDMYFVVPRRALTKGLYALHVGPFGGDMPLIADGYAYDVAIGAESDLFLSYDEVLRIRQESAREIATALVNRLNEMFNSQDYSQLGEVYRPGGRPLTLLELERYIEESRNWLDAAGKIIRWEMSDITVSEDGSSARCAIISTYEKFGKKMEFVWLGKIGDRFFVTSIK